MDELDLPPAGLNALYNKKVKSAEWMIRPKDGLYDWVPDMYPTTHSGIRVTLEDQSQFLIHKGQNYGKSSATVVTDAKHMSDKWEVKDHRDFELSQTVGDLVKAAGDEYRIETGDQCHTAAEDMMNLNLEEEKPFRPCVFFCP